MSQLLLSICSKVICKIILLFDISSPAAPPNGSDYESAGGMNIPHASQISKQKTEDFTPSQNLVECVLKKALCTNLVVNV